jgi:hypothetical protein
MKIGFFGDSFCSDIQNHHSLENNYQTYIDKLSKKYNAEITNTGVGGSSVWDLVLLQFQPLTLPDVCVFVWTDHHRLFHRSYRKINASSIQNKSIDSSLQKPAQEYYKHFYDEEKHKLEYQSLLFYFDKNILSKHKNTKFIHLWSFDDDYPHRWETGVEIRPALETISIRSFDIFPKNDVRANHIEGEQKNKLVSDCISTAINNYQNGLLLSFVQT